MTEKLQIKLLLFMKIRLPVFEIFYLIIAIYLFFEF